MLAAEVGYKSGQQSLLLDLGCADHFLKPACEEEGWIYRGLDFVDVNFEIVIFPVENNSVNYTVSLAVIEHLRDQEKFLSEIYRYLKPGGGVYISTPNFQLD